MTPGKARGISSGGGGDATRELKFVDQSRRKKKQSEAKKNTSRKIFRSKGARGNNRGGKPTTRPSPTLRGFQKTKKKTTTGREKI